MDIISGFEGKDIKEAIKIIKETWEKEGIKDKGKTRYKLILGRINQRGIFTPTVSTVAGTENIILWNLSQDNINELEEEAKKIGLPISFRSFLWFEKVPRVLPRENAQEEKETVSTSYH